MTVIQINPNGDDAADVQQQLVDAREIAAGTKEIPESAVPATTTAAITAASDAAATADSKAVAAQADATQALTETSALDTRVSSTESDISTLQSDVTTVDDKADTAITSAAQALTDAATAQTDVNAINAKSPAATVVSVAAAISAVDNDVVEVGDVIQTISYVDGAGVGGNHYEVMEKIDTPDEDGGLVIHCDGNKYLQLINYTFLTPEDFGAVGDGTTDYTTELQNWLNSSKTLFAYSAADQKEFIYTKLTMNGENKKITVIGDVKFTSTDTSTDSKFVITGDYATIERGFWACTGGAGATIETQGFQNYLNYLQVSGSHDNALKINGLETHVIKGRYRGGNTAAIDILKADAYLDGPYVEGSKDGVRTSGVGSVNGYHIHSFNNTRHAFNLSGASFSQLTSCYADTSGENGYSISDTSSGLTLTDCWAFNSAELVAGGVGYQFFNAKNVKLIGCRISGSGAAGTSGSVRFSGSDNQVDLIGCYADDDVLDFAAPSTMVGCTGALAKYNGNANQYRTYGNTIAASGTLSVSITVKAANSFSTPGLRSYKAYVTYRQSSGGTAGGTEFAFIYNNSWGANTIEYVHPAAPKIEITGVTVVDNGNNTATITLDFTNNEANAHQFAVQLEDMGTSRGYN